MKQTLAAFTLSLIFNFSFGQHLYPEKFDNCQLHQFCLDCGEPKAGAPHDLEKELLENLNSKYLRKIAGSIEVQILIDTLGNPCLLSAKNESNIKTDKLDIQSAIHSTSKWSPAISQEKSINSSVSLKLNFVGGVFSIERRVFDFTLNTNMKSVGTPEVKGTKVSKLSERWTVYNQQNSDLPWDMSRAVVVDQNGLLWFGTDNGIVKMTKDKMEIFNCKTSPLKSPQYNKNETVAVRDAAVDHKNNKWFIAGWDVYKFDNDKWTIYDSINSPISWARTIFVDNLNNVWFTSWDGVIKYDGTTWSVLNSSNAELPTNKVLGVYMDSKERLWIGTFEGNVRIENGRTTRIKDTNSPLDFGFISKMYEDKSGNLWFDLFNDKDKSKSGMFVLKTNGEWESMAAKGSNIFTQNSVNDFLLDEETKTVWIALNTVGLIKYDIVNKVWETYTTENSNVPSIHVMKLAKDDKGFIWAATFAGVMRLN